MRYIEIMKIHKIKPPCERSYYYSQKSRADNSSTLKSELTKQVRHLNGGVRGVEALVASLRAGALDRLID